MKKKLYYFIIPLFVFTISIGLSPTDTAFAKDTDGIATVHKEMSKLLPGEVITGLTPEKSWIEKQSLVEGEKQKELAAADIPLENLRFVMHKDPYDVQYAAVVETLPATFDTSTQAKINENAQIAYLEITKKEGRHYTKPIVAGNPGVVPNDPFFINSLQTQA